MKLVAMDNISKKLAEKAVRCEKCKFAFSIAAFKEHTCFDKKKKKSDKEDEHQYYVDGRMLTRKYFKWRFKFKCEDCENWYCYEDLDFHHCFKDSETFMPNKNGKYQCDICGFELQRLNVVKHYNNYHHR